MEKEQKPKYIVYKHVSPSGKVYIGQTKFTENPNKRWRNGLHYKECTSFYRAIKKYGWNNIKHYIIATNLTSKEADFFEMIFIKIYKKCGICYNINDGGKGCPGFWESKEGKEYAKHIVRGVQHPKFGTHLSEETKRKISIANKGKVYRKGYKHSLETIEKIRKSRSVKVYQFSKNGDFIQKWNSLTEIEVALGYFTSNISKCLSGKIISAYGYIWSLTNNFPGVRQKKQNVHPRTQNTIDKWRHSMEGKFGRAKGHKLTDEQKEKLRQCNPFKKPVIQYSASGKFIAEWNSASEASRFVEIPKSCICRCCNGKFKTSKGFIWKWKHTQQE